MEIWSEATGGELVLLAHAVRVGWPIPLERRPAIIRGLFDLLEHADDRRALGITRVVLAMDQVNLDLMCQSLNH